jgi:hypothetical protein
MIRETTLASIREIAGQFSGWPKEKQQIAVAHLTQEKEPVKTVEQLDQWGRRKLLPCPFCGAQGSQPNGEVFCASLGNLSESTEYPLTIHPMNAILPSVRRKPNHQQGKKR